MSETSQIPTERKLILEILPQNFDWRSPEWNIICGNLSRAMRADADVLSVSSPSITSVPKDAKGDPLTIGMFVIALASAPAVSRIINVLNTWVSNLGNRRVKITLQTGTHKFTAEISGFSESAIAEILKQLPQ